MITDSNGDTTTEVFDATARTFTTEFPSGRTAVSEMDGHGRTTGWSYDGVQDAHLSWDPAGGLGTMAQD